MSYICAYNETPKFMIYTISNNILDATFQFPMAGIRGIAPDNQRDMIVKKGYNGTTYIKDKGFICNWNVDYSEFFSAENLYNLFKPLLGFALKPDIFRIDFYPNTDSNSTEHYDILLMNKEFKIKEIHEGDYVKGYEGLILELQSRKRIIDFTSQWQLIQPQAEQVIGVLNMQNISISN